MPQAVPPAKHAPPLPQLTISCRQDPTAPGVDSKPLDWDRHCFWMSASQGAVMMPPGYHTKKAMCRERPNSRRHSSSSCSALDTRHFLTTPSSLPLASSSAHSLCTGIGTGGTWKVVS